MQITVDTTLVIFTCEGREYLLKKTYESFLAATSYKFSKIILAVDGAIKEDVFSFINPDMIIYNYKRKGYVASVINVMAHIHTEFFFWLEDDWQFKRALNIEELIGLLQTRDDWAQIAYSKNEHLPAYYKDYPLDNKLYQNMDGFTANPCICRSHMVIEAFNDLQRKEKGDRLGVDGFENSLSLFFKQRGNTCAIQDPEGNGIITHDGYLESTPRNWHMTNSLENKTEKHLLTIPKPAMWRRMLMMLKLTRAYLLLTTKQFVDNEAYEFCFRVVASVKLLNKK